MTAPATVLGRLEPFAANAGAGTVVFVHGLEVMASIGVHPHEMESRQRILVDVDLDLGDIAPPTDDRLAETLDYQEIAKRVETLAREGHVQLVETLAERIALWCLNDERVRAVTVRVAKPEALTNAAAAGCVITRRRP